jgi:hypothetical protein
MFFASTIGSTIIRWIIIKRNNISGNNFVTKKNLHLKYLKGYIFNMSMNKRMTKNMIIKKTMVLDYSYL